MLEPFFMGRIVMDDDDDDDEEGGMFNPEKTEGEKRELEEFKKDELLRVQEEAAVKQKNRKEVMGELLRSKGFLWMATAMDVMAGWQQAGNVIRIDPGTQLDLILMILQFLMSSIVLNRLPREPMDVPHPRHVEGKPGRGRGPEGHQQTQRRGVGVPGKG